MDVFAPAVGQHQIRPLAFGYLAAILQIKRRGRVFRHQANRLGQRKAVALVVGHPERRVEQAGGVVVGRENIQQAEGRELACRDVAGVRAAAHDVRCAHQDVHAVLAGGFSRLERGGEFGDHAAKMVGFKDMIVRGIVMAGQRDIAVPAHRRNSDTVRLRPPCRKRQLLFFITGHLRVAERIFALVVFAILFNVGELTLPRRVVHQGDQRHRLAADQLFKQRQGSVVR